MNNAMQAFDLDEAAGQGNLDAVQAVLGQVETWFHSALEDALETAVTQGHVDVAQALLEAGAKPAELDGRVWNPLLDRDDLAMLRWLAEHGDPQHDDSGPLRQATGQHHWAAAAVLAPHSDASAVDSVALVEAGAGAPDALIEALIQAGARPQVMASAPLQAAARGQHLGSVRALLPHSDIHAAVGALLDQGDIASADTLLAEASLSDSQWAVGTYPGRLQRAQVRVLADARAQAVAGHPARGGPGRVRS